MKFLGYVRVSTREQATLGLSLDMQKQKITSYCEINGWVLVEIIADEGISAKDLDHRPKLKRVIDDLLAGRADGLVFWSLDRVFRNTKDAINTSDIFNKNGKALVSVSEKIDTTSPMGEFFFSLSASLGQLERRLTSERVKVCIERKKAQGEHLGEVPFGYTSDGKFLKYDMDQQKVIATVRDLSGQGMSYRNIAKELNSQQIPTKRGKYWSSPQIMRLVNQV